MSVIQMFDHMAPPLLYWDSALTWWYRNILNRRTLLPFGIIQVINTCKTSGSNMQLFVI